MQMSLGKPTAAALAVFAFGIAQLAYKVHCQWRAIGYRLERFAQATHTGRPPAFNLRAHLRDRGERPAPDTWRKFWGADWRGKVDQIIRVVGD